ncbi:MAG: Grx4 family monothiol glutaredoxin [Bacteriovorax sp.]|nr:Grx4 family monothiol glutaredoxin [Bacteriovorax sp.]
MSNPFQVVGGNAIDESEQNKGLDLSTRCANLINSAPIMLFMKGTPDMPQCGFSANVVKILNHVGVSFNTFNILSDMDIRDGIKQYSNWPTYPQLYVKGQLVGGNDIITEMMNNGELEGVLKL